MLQIIKYILLLNATRFRSNPIGIREAMLSIRGEGKKQYLYQLKQWWNEENFYDVETL